MSEPSAKRRSEDVREGILLGMGNPLLDISAEVELSLLEKYGLEANNAILAEDKHQTIYDDLVDGHKVEYIAGGATQNSIRVAQWLLHKKHATGYIGCIGDDKYGKELSSKASGDGVNTNYRIDESTPTGTCAVLITGKNRSMVANLAAANCYKKDHLDQKEIWSLVEGANFFYIGGFFLTVSPDSMVAVGQHAAANKKTFSMNLSAPFLSQFFLEPMMKVMPYVDILFGNETEMAAFGKAQDFGTEDLKEIGRKISALAKENGDVPRKVVITQGDKPTIVVQGDSVQEYAVIEIAADDIVDTNGAGDAFVGGYLSELVRGSETSECVRCAHYAANLIIQRSGCTYPEVPNFS
eukprot:scpid77799/ scgid6209/ Adenosine kinase; Adenosine 5&apos